MAIDADNFHVLATAGNNFGPFTYKIGSSWNTNEPEGLDFFDTACYAAQHGGQVPGGAGFASSQLHALVIDNNESGWDTVYLKHYSGKAGSLCDGGGAIEQDVLQSQLSTAQGAFCSTRGQDDLLACDGFEGADRVSWTATNGGEGSWKIVEDESRGGDFGVLVEKDADGMWHDHVTCGPAGGYSASQTVTVTIRLGTASSNATDSQVAVAYALYQDPGNAYYAALDAAGQVSLRKRINGVDNTLATASISPPGKGWTVLSLRVFPTTDTQHPPAGRLWAVVSLGAPSGGAIPALDGLADPAPAWTSGCAGIGTHGMSGAFDDFVVSSP